MTTYSTKTPRASLTLEVTDALTQWEWDTLTASLAALYTVVVPEGTRTVTELLSGLDELGKADDELTEAVQEATSDWATPPTSNANTFRGPLDASVMGLRLHEGDTAVVTPSHKEVHVGTMHRWVGDRQNAYRYSCGHGGCHASVTVTQEPF